MRASHTWESGETAGGLRAPGRRPNDFAPSMIRKLSADMINKIAAGEVIERPASVVKELVENAIDAGARRIEVELSGGGTKLVRVSDDGRGIPRAELHLAVASHATSKLHDPEDLFRIGSLGFRGEALASIAAVSHLRLASRPPGETGAELRVDGGQRGDVRPAGVPPGTTVEAADLFFNVPARREYLRTERGELRAALGELKKQALAHPELGLRVLADGNVVLDAPPADEPRERIAQVLGRELAEDLLVVGPREEAGIRLRGYASPCDRSRGDSRQQFFILNGRAVRDVTLLTAVKQAYANLLPPRRHPSVVLWIDLDPADVDVNVHPQKAEVRFRRDRIVFRVVLDALREALSAGGLVAELRLGRQGERGRRFAERVEGSPDSALAQSAASVTALLPFPAAGPVGGVGGAPVPLDAVPRRFLQVHRRYVVEETEGGVRLVDPHALHERILYEEIRARLEREPLESQRFLFPQIVEVAADEVAACEERAELLARLGFEVTPFGRSALAVHAAPAMLPSERVGEGLQRLLGPPGVLGPEEGDEGILHGLAATLACRSAVRFGDPLPDDQIEALLRQRPHVRRGHCCPHGRPTALALSLDELDRRFGRQGKGT
ncbi:MAG: DNA mismatch repair endonuclease MutL [Planctomycetota bacterium]|nr:MAG: DNA mismatch repair endonuclease MutL [Planctomycetota bacterium]